MGYCGCGLGARRVAHLKQFGNECIEIEGGARDGAGNDTTLHCVCVCVCECVCVTLYLHLLKYQFDAIAYPDHV